LSAFDYWRSDFDLLGTVFKANNLSASELLLWDHTKLVGCKSSKGASNANYSLKTAVESDRKSGWASH
jgi:hypothetical protein